MFLGYVGQCGVLVLALLVSATPEASNDIIIHMEPNFVYPDVTQSVTMTCTMTSGAVTEKSLNLIVMQIKKSRPASQIEGRISQTTDNALILLAGVNFNEGAKIHVQQDDTHDRRLEAEGDLGEPRLVVTIKRPGLDDVGMYLCQVTAMQNNYEIVQLWASANLSLLGEEGSTAHLLAQQEALKSHEERAELERVALQEEIHRLSQNQRRLAHQLQHLQNHSLALSQRLSELTGGHPESTETLSSSEGQSEAVSATSASSTQDRLQSISHRMDTLEQRQSAGESSTETEQRLSEGEEERKELRDRLDTVETQRLSEIEARLTQVETLADNNKNRIDEIENRVLDSLKTACYVCGDKESSQPCSLEDLTTGAPVKCPLDAGYCMNEVMQDNRGRKIYKRCASQEECSEGFQSQSEECATFTILFSGDIHCQFCCDSNGCNDKTKPADLYQP